MLAILAISKKSYHAAHMTQLEMSADETGREFKPVKAKLSMVPLHSHTVV